MTGDSMTGAVLRLPPAGRIDWGPVLARGGRWSALVRAGSTPALVARHSVGLVHVSAPYVSAAQERGAWHVWASTRASVLAAVEVGRLAACGVTAVCPAVQMAEIAHARALCEDAPEPLDQKFWADWARPILNAARLLVIPDLPGWRSCPQVWSDLRFALAHTMPVHVYGDADAR